MAQPLEEKTEAPTGKKKSEARSKGNVAKSADLSTALMLLFGSVLIYFLGGSLVWSIKGTMISFFKNPIYENFDIATLHSLIINAASRNMNSLLPILGGFMVIAAVSSFSQVGFNFSPKALNPNFKKLDPFSGIKNIMFSKKALVKLVMSIVKLIIVGVIAYFSIRKDIEPLMELVSMRVEVIFSSASNLIFAITLKISIILLILALLDFLYQRWQHNKDLMMTKYEVKQETKQSEGDPLVKSRIRTIQRQVAKQRMMDAVPEADVVVSNPTHYAVALKYDTATMSAPKVIAKGLDSLALKIMEKAREHHIPVVEDRVLVRVLYKAVELNGEIPSDLYTAVAKVLSYVYQLRNIVGNQAIDTRL